MAKETPSTAVTPSNRLETPSKERNDIAGGDGNHAPPGSSSPRRRFLEGLEKRHQCRRSWTTAARPPAHATGSRDCRPPTARHWWRFSSPSKKRRRGLEEPGGA